MNSFENNIIQEDMNIIYKSIDYSIFNNKSVFISGAAGMLASYMVYFLIYLNENIEGFKCKIILNVKQKSKLQARYGLYLNKDYLKIYESDLSEKIEIEDNIDFIIHAASIAQTQFFSTNPIDVILPNTIGTKNLLDLAYVKNVQSFLFFSTCSVYGKVSHSNYIDEETFGVLDPLDVNSCYSESKRLGESLCKAYYTQKNVNVKISRIAHTYGPTIDIDNDNRVFSEFIKNIVNNENIILKSKGDAVRSFLYLRDATIAFYKILINGKCGEAYNVSNPDQNVSIKELANRLVKEFQEKNLEIEYSEKDVTYEENKFDNKIIYSIEKLQKVGWEPTVSIEEGFRRTVNSIKEEKK